MAGNSYFRFKQFTVFQENVSMRVNTDGVLLGAWCRIPEKTTGKILDIGTGTGVLPMNLYSYGAEWIGTDIADNRYNSCRKASRVRRGS